MFPHGFEYLNTWLPTGGAFKEVMEPLGVALLGKIYHWGQAWGFIALCHFQLTLSASYVQRCSLSQPPAPATMTVACCHASLP